MKKAILLKAFCSFFVLLAILTIRVEQAFSMSFDLLNNVLSSEKSFKFIGKATFAPSLSPNDKWLVYKMSSLNIHDNKHSRELYYTQINHKHKKTIPYCPPEFVNKVGVVYGNVKWSPTGEILATFYDFDDETYIGLVNFSGDKPKHIESFKGKSAFVWCSEKELLYIDEYGNLVKRSPRNTSEYVIKHRTSFKDRGYIDKFQLASNGTIIYGYDLHSGQPPYQTNLANPDKRTTLTSQPLHIKPTRNQIFTRTFNMSPNGDYVIIDNPKKYLESNTMVSLIDLRTLKTMDTFSVKDNSKKVLWSPDGTKLAYNDHNKQKYGYPYFIIYDLITGKKRNYGIKVSDYFNWTPDSNHIIYGFKQKTGGRFELGIFILRLSDDKEIGKLSDVGSQDIYMSPSMEYVLWQGLNKNAFFIAKNPYKSRMKNH